MIENDRRLHSNTARINQALDEAFPLSEENGLLEKSIRYTLLAPGKRIRPHLTLEFCKLFGQPAERALPYACAIEMVHAAHIIADDLPCLDNGDLRRGRPTNHRVYGEATATIAVSALFAQACNITATNPALDSVTNARAVALLAQKIGSDGMCGGEEQDILNEDQQLEHDDLVRINRMKTGSLFEAACCLGCIAAGANEEDLANARTFALNFGAAFQIIDDLLDVTVPTKELGKSALSDVKNLKTTFVSLYGKNGAAQLAHDYTEQAVQAIQSYPNSDYLVQFAYDMLERKK